MDLVLTTQTLESDLGREFFLYLATEKGMEVIEKIDELSKILSLVCIKEGIIEKSVNFAELD